MKIKDACSYDKPKQHIKKQRGDFADKCLYTQNYGFSSSHVRMWELDPKEGWMPKYWYFQIVVLKKSRESLGQQGDKTSQSQRKSTLNTHWKDWCWSWSSSTLATWREELTHWEDPDAGKDWGQEEKGVTEDEMVGWRLQFNGHEFEQIPGDCEGQGSLACCSLWGHKESDTTEQLNNN